jgi:hypothetical protein
MVETLSARARDLSTTRHSALRESAAVPSAIRSIPLYLRMTKRLAGRRGATIGERLGRLDDRLVFVLGSPRSGTTFLAGAIGSAPGFVDLGEVPPVKAAVPELAALPPEEAARRLRRALALARRAGLVGSVRAVEQTPELAHLVDVVAAAFPRSRVVHIVRDGRDVACSLLEKPWLREEARGADDAGLSHGSHARFWVEPERRREFESATGARRAAWVWRSYVSAARSASAPVVELRYERLAEDPEAAARELASALDAPEAPLAAALSRVHTESVGRHRRDLTDEQLAEVLDEAGELLRELGYLT